MTTLRAVLVGCGGMGNNWARILGRRPDIRIAGLVDVVPAASAALADRCGLQVPCFETLDDALGALDVDVVLDTSIPETRRQIAGAAMEAGCHVLSEKPFAASVEEAQELLAISARTGKTHAVMQNRRYWRAPRACVNWSPMVLSARWGWSARTSSSARTSAASADEMANVLLLDMAIHTFDQARFMTDSDAVTAWCDEFNLPGSWYQGNASALAVFEMTKRFPVLLPRFLVRARRSHTLGGRVAHRRQPWHGDLGRSVGTLRRSRRRCRRLRATDPARRNHRRLAPSERPRRLPRRNGHRVGQRRTADDPFGRQRQEPGDGPRRNRECLHASTRAAATRWRRACPVPPIGRP